jgi:hypothetical protein
MDYEQNYYDPDLYRDEQQRPVRRFINPMDARRYENRLVDMQLDNGQTICNALITYVAPTTDRRDPTYGSLYYVVCRRNTPYMTRGNIRNVTQIMDAGGLCGRR